MGLHCMIERKTYVGTHTHAVRRDSYAGMRNAIVMTCAVQLSSLRINKNFTTMLICQSARYKIDYFAWRVICTISKLHVHMREKYYPSARSSFYMQCVAVLTMASHHYNGFTPL